MTLMIYGASGYTGRLASEHAKGLGLDCLLAGRTEETIEATASALQFPYRVFDLTNQQVIDTALQGVTVVLSCAGPFRYTSKFLMDACIRNGVDYLDIAAELDSYLLAGEYDKRAIDSGVMLLPGCGSSVAMLGCLASHATVQVTNAVSIDIALRVSGPFSRGSAASAKNFAGCLQLADNMLVEQDVITNRSFDFQDGKGDADCFPVTLPELITVAKATGIRNIRTYVHVAGGALPTEDSLEDLDGPTLVHREQNPYHGAVIVTDLEGNERQFVLHTVNGYTFTSAASAEAAKRVLDGARRPGFQTPVEVFGTSFVMTVAGTMMQ